MSYFIVLFYSYFYCHPFKQGRFLWAITGKKSRDRDISVINSVEYPVCLLLRFQNNLSMANEAYWQASLNTGNTQAPSQSWNIPHLSNKQQPDICAALLFKVNILRKDWRNLHLMHANLWYFKSGSLPQKNIHVLRHTSVHGLGSVCPLNRGSVLKASPSMTWVLTRLQQNLFDSLFIHKKCPLSPVICQAWVMCQQLRAGMGAGCCQWRSAEICRDLLVHLTRLRNINQIITYTWYYKLWWSPFKKGLGWGWGWGQQRRPHSHKPCT